MVRCKVPDVFVLLWCIGRDKIGSSQAVSGCTCVNVKRDVVSEEEEVSTHVLCCCQRAEMKRCRLADQLDAVRGVDIMSRGVGAELLMGTVWAE